MSNAYQYTVIFQNNSSTPGMAGLFQQDPTPTHSWSLAWLTKYAYPTTFVNFQWQLDYGFAWSQTGILGKGVVMSASQYWPADLSTTNQVTLTYDAPNRAFTFANQTAGPQSGSLFVNQDGTIPSNVAAVGIGMAGFPTFVVQAQANVMATFTPNPQYWIAFGNYAQGQVVDISTMNNPAQIVFPPNVYSMTAVLNPDLSWTIAQTQFLNEQFLAAQTAGKEARWGEA